MGNQHTKNENKGQFTAEERTILETSYTTVLLLKPEESRRSMSNSHLAKCTSKYLLRRNSSSMPLERFAEPYVILEHGTTDEKVRFITACFDNTQDTQAVTAEVENYVTSVLRSFIKIQSQQKNQEFESWRKNGYQSSDTALISLSKSITSNLTDHGENQIDTYRLEKWLGQNPLFLEIWREVFTSLYSFHAGNHVKLGRELSTVIIPQIEGLNPGTNYSPILDIAHVIFLNSNLPNELQYKWRFLFSSKTMGESFSTMLGKIINKGPTLLIVEDEDSYIFAGYAPSPWTLSPIFVGDESSMLFTLSPTLQAFSATGYNDHFQYLNLNQQTMPNGLGMGGQFGYWGLWIDCEYGKGRSSESCTTYRGYTQLSKQKDFRIRNLEVFAIGDEKRDDEDEAASQRSVLDRNLEDRVILELSGKQMHSEGLREPDMDL